MTAEKKDRSKEKQEAPIPQPVDITDGIPDRSTRRPVWLYVLIAVIFLLWAAVLVYFYLAGRP